MAATGGVPNMTGADANGQKYTVSYEARLLKKMIRALRD